MKNIKDKIIISMLNKLGVGVNAYIHDINRAYFLTNMLNKLLPDMSVVVSDKSKDNEIIISINDELFIKYKVENTRVVSIELQNV